jgi:microcompartment protein CcmL/EutN
VTPKSPGAPAAADFPTLALLEIDSLAVGYVVADQVVKAAAVTLLKLDAVTPGKFLVLFTGPLGDVETGFAAGRAAAGEDLLDDLLLPDAHPAVLPAWDEAPGAPGESLGLLECRTVAAGLLAADRALKAADVALLSLRVARGIGGRVLILLTGRLHDTEAALDAGARAAEGRSALLRRRLVARTHPDLAAHMVADRHRGGTT